MQFKAQVRLVTKLYELYSAGANERGNEEMRQTRKLYNMKAADIFVKTLKNEGVQHIFGLPGEETLGILDAISRSNIKFILTRHEQAAGFMAATYGRLTGKAGVAIGTLGPGATNFATAAAFSTLGAMPAVFITGQKPIHSSKQGRFQIVDVVGMMKPLTKSSAQIPSARQIPSLVRNAFRLAEEERPGASHLEFPEDVVGEDVAESRLIPKTEAFRPVPDKKAIAPAVKMLLRAKRPLILIGSAGNRKDFSRELLSFIRATDIPFFTTHMGKGAVPEDHKLFLGTAALSKDDYLHSVIEEADLILSIGYDVVERPPYPVKKGSAEVVHINFFSAQSDEVYFPTHDVVGDIGETLRNMKEALPKRLPWNTTSFLADKKHIDERLLERADSARFPMLPQRIVADVRATMPRDGIVALDNGMYKIWFARHYRVFERNTLLLDNALATMGAGLPSAIAAKLVYPKRKVLAVCGDGGFLMNSQELETAVRLKLNLVVLVLRDDGFGMVKWNQERGGHADIGLSFGNPDFVRYAESYGAKGYRVSKAEELRPVLEKALNARGVSLIEVAIDYSENKKIFDEELSQKSAK